MTFVFGTLATLSFILMLWQWIVALRFPLHRRAVASGPCPPVSVLKPVKGVDETTAASLRSWLEQKYPAEVQILFGVASEDDPGCGIIKQLMRECDGVDERLIICPESFGANAKVSKLIRLLGAASHEVVIVSDADVRVPQDFLLNTVPMLRDETVGLVNCFYRFANPTTLAMQWEATATNADFWSQVLQSRSIKPMDFALGAVMLTRQKQIREIGGFEAIADCLADDYQLGNRILKRGHRVELSTMVVDCFDSPKSWADVWKHQLRWARTIRVCQPLPYFFSILSNVTFWALAWLIAQLASGKALIDTGLADEQIQWCAVLPLAFLGARMFVAVHLQRRLEGDWKRAIYFWLAPLKDVFQAVIWLLAFAGDRIEWRGEKYRLRRDGVLQKASEPVY